MKTNVNVAITLFLSFFVLSCSTEDNSDVAVIRGTPKSSTIKITTTRSAGNILGNNSSGPLTRALNDDPFTEVRKVSCFESVILPELQSHIWIGNLLMKSSIISCNYIPLIYPRNPITVSLTLSGTEPQIIQSPSYSSFLNYIQQQSTKGSFMQNDEFNFTVEQFSSYNELKVAFGSNVNTNGIFWGSSSSSSETDHLINKATGLYVKFYQTSFKALMDYPEEEIATIPDNLIDSAVYVNSITYGRMGILTLETNETAYEAQEKINKIFKTIFSSSSYTFTQEEQSFLNGCDFKVYLIGGIGSTSVESFTGLDGFIQHIKKGAFSRDVPGTPIFCTFNHVKDNSPVSVDFEFTVKKDPLYVEIKHEPILNVPKTNQFGTNIKYSLIKGYGQIRIYFYRNRSKVPTIADPRITIKVGCQRKVNDYYSDRIIQRTGAFEREIKNAGYQTSALLTWKEQSYAYGPRGEPTYVDRSIVMMHYYYNNNRKLTPYNAHSEYWDEYYLIDTNDYEILGVSLNQDNCPLGKL